MPAEIVGDDPNADVALLKVDPAGLELTPLRLGRSRRTSRSASRWPRSAARSASEQSLSVGVVSALDRNIESLTRFGIGDAIQTDAAINPGNSGGPLLDAHGRVIGINAQIKSQSGGGEGVGFAIPVDTVRRSLARAARDGRVDYGYLGVHDADPLAAARGAARHRRRGGRARAGGRARQPRRRRGPRAGGRHDRASRASRTSRRTAT